MLEKSQRFVGPDEPIRYVFTGQVGLRPTWRFLSFWLVVTNRPRIIVVTANRILVLKAGQLRYARKTPKSFLFEVPRSTLFGPLKGGWSKVQLGNEQIWVARLTYPFLEKANAEIGVPATV